MSRTDDVNSSPALFLYVTPLSRPMSSSDSTRAENSSAFLVASSRHCASDSFGQTSTSGFTCPIRDSQTCSAATTWANRSSVWGGGLTASVRLAWTRASAHRRCSYNRVREASIFRKKPPQTSQIKLEMCYIERDKGALRGRRPGGALRLWELYLTGEA